MTPRERIVAVIEGERLDTIPLWREGPMDVTVQKALFGEPVGNPIADELRFLRYFDNCVASAQIGFQSNTISKDETHHTYEYETGAVWHESYDPTFCREATRFPINTPEEAVGYVMPEVDIPERVDREALTRRIEALHEAGYFVEGTVPGAWMGIYYYLTSFSNILMWMAIEPDAARALFGMMSEFSLRSAEILLECGVDCVFTASDLGSGRGLLFSEEMFRIYVFPWLREIAELCHEKNAYFHLHSHGHIQEVMDGIVEAGVDVVNPIGPGDHNDLSVFKRRWGDRIVIHGGIGTTIRDMGESEMRSHVKSVVGIGRAGGRFIPRTESGIPSMPIDKVKLYIDILHEACDKGFC